LKERTDHEEAGQGPSHSEEDRDFRDHVEDEPVTFGFDAIGRRGATRSRVEDHLRQEFEHCPKTEIARPIEAPRGGSRRETLFALPDSAGRIQGALLRRLE
jgi:hypothetical protein